MVIFGKGQFAYLGGHDPEDYTHAVGDQPTMLELHKNSSRIPAYPYKCPLSCC